ncbi:hypothetical protein CS542_07465 [Pedobacter sp. IW39]|nr:hypothetical protein CS542_07465 [Pedobacter sp. IW39]
MLLQSRAFKAGNVALKYPEPWNRRQKYIRYRFKTCDFDQLEEDVLGRGVAAKLPCIKYHTTK